MILVIHQIELYFVYTENIMMRFYKTGCLYGCLLFMLGGCIKSNYEIANARLSNKVLDQETIYCGIDEDNVLVLTLDEAIRIGLERNLEAQVKLLEFAVQEETLTAAYMKLIPKLMVNGATTWRNKNTGAFSESLVAGIPPAPLSIGLEQRSKNWEFNLTWNILDFGVSYYKARQEADKVLVQSFEYERIRQNLILEVVRKYWKLASEIKGDQCAKAAEEFSLPVLERVQQQVERGNLSPLLGSRMSSEILEKVRILQENHKQYLSTLSEFRNLLGLPPEVEIKLADMDEIIADLELPDVSELEEISLLYRPELYSRDMQEAAWADEVRSSLLQIFPELAPFTSKNFDSNRFLLFHHWWMIGLRASWNLYGIPDKIAMAEVAQKQKELNRKNRILQSLSIITQVNLAYNLYYNELENYRTAQAWSDARNTTRKIFEKQRVLYAAGDVDYAIASLEACVADIDAWRTYADLVGYLELINNSIGVPRYFSYDPNADSDPEVISDDLCEYEDNFDSDLIEAMAEEELIPSAFAEDETVTDSTNQYSQQL